MKHYWAAYLGEKFAGFLALTNENIYLVQDSANAFSVNDPTDPNYEKVLTTAIRLEKFCDYLILQAQREETYE